MIFSRRSTRRSCSSSYHARDASLNEISEEPDQEEPLSPTKSPKARVPLRNQLSRHITRLFSQSDDLPSKPDPKPRYKTAPFHRFMSETFPGSVKLEEHQVAAIIRHDFFRKVRHPLPHWNLGFCGVPAPPGSCILVCCVSTAGDQQDHAWHRGLLCQPNYTRAGISIMFNHEFIPNCHYSIVIAFVQVFLQFAKVQDFGSWARKFVKLSVLAKESYNTLS